MKEKLHILHLEDDVVDAELVAELLRKEGLELHTDRVDELAAFEKGLRKGHYSIIFSDFGIPGVEPLEALQLAQRFAPEVPFVFISGTLAEDQAIEALRLGATDYVLKNQMRRLGPAVKKALEQTRELAGRRRAEAALRRSEARLNGIISSAMDAIISIDASQKVVLFNRAAEEMFGWKADQVIGKHVSTFIPSRFHTAHERDVQKFGMSGVSNRSMGNLGALRGLRANGEEFPIEASISQIEVEGEILFTVILRDVTGREQVERELAEARNNLAGIVAERTAQLVEANTNLQTFAYTAAHDLRAPLRTMKSFSSILLEECSPQLEGECATYLQRVVNAAGQMEHLLNDLLEYSKVSQADVMLAAVDLNTAIADALKLEESDIRLQEATVQVQSSMPQALGHPATVLLILTNFISNALKFIRPPAKPMIRIYAETRGHYVRVTVEDNGIGVRPEDQPKLFGVFQRLHGKQQFPGTGLGLAIARKGAERMGGRVGVESAPSEGSRFWLELPAAETA